MKRAEMRERWATIWAETHPADRSELLHNMKPKRRKPMSDKIYRVLVILLLTAIAVGLYLPVFEKPSEACQDTIEAAQSMVLQGNSRITSLENLYQTGVYTRAENINQQNLMANEAIFGAQVIQLSQNYAALAILANCH